EPTPGASGWPPHCDDANRPNRVTVWIPLSDATLDNGCMYVVPRDRAAADADARLQACRALPAAAGSILGWNFDVLHWGSTCTRPGEPRIAISQEFIAPGAATAADELPLV